jgi:hypothetical protein
MLLYIHIAPEYEAGTEKEREQREREKRNPSQIANHARHAIRREEQRFERDGKKHSLVEYRWTETDGEDACCVDSIVFFFFFFFLLSLFLFFFLFSFWVFLPGEIPRFVLR